MATNILRCMHSIPIGRHLHSKIGYVWTKDHRPTNGQEFIHCFVLTFLVCAWLVYVAGMVYQCLCSKLHDACTKSCCKYKAQFTKMETLNRQNSVPLTCCKPLFQLPPLKFVRSAQALHKFDTVQTHLYMCALQLYSK